MLTYLIDFLVWFNNVITSLQLHLNRVLEKILFLGGLSFPVLVILAVVCAACIGLLFYQLLIQSES
ncbi:hypothetical protein RV18_GL000603 [Enterococcus termitis]|nr:hypothetical protein RV18_GL000603 [Enterococcus termitis]